MTHLLDQNMCSVMRNVVKAIRRRDMKSAARKYTFTC